MNLKWTTIILLLQRNYGLLNFGIWVLVLNMEMGLKVFFDPRKPMQFEYHPNWNWIKSMNFVEYKYTLPGIQGVYQSMSQFQSLITEMVWFSATGTFA